jgi:hypothetical protein
MGEIVDFTEMPRGSRVFPKDSPYLTAIHFDASAR